MGVRVGAEVHEGPVWVSASTQVSGRRRRNTRRSLGWGWVILIAVILTTVNAPWWAILLTGIVMGTVIRITSHRQSNWR
jgi:hypothetical protein